MSASTQTTLSLIDQLSRENIYLHKNIFNNQESIDIIIYGAGNTGKKIFYLVTKYSPLHVSAFLDRAARPGQEISGIPVYKLENYRIKNEALHSIYVIVAVHNREYPIGDIIKNLRDFGFINILNMVDFYNLFPSELENSFWLIKSSEYLNYKNELLRCAELWADAPSLDLYNSLLRQRFLGEYSALPEPDRGRQYFPKELSDWKYPLRLVDCGAYNGDSIRLARDLGIKINCVYAFEPDKENYKILSEYLRKQKNFEYKVWQLGVYSSKKKIGFIREGAEGSRISENSSNNISVINLDDFLGGFSPNYIKMDVEGAEFEAILGTQKKIKKYRPGLAICIYHSPHHIWQIPLMIQRWDLNYKFYLRSHAYNGFDIVMYAFVT